MTQDQRDRHNEGRRRAYRANPKKYNARNRAWYHANKEKYAENQQRVLYGLSPETRLALLSFQNNRCAICQRDFYGRIRIFTDHIKGTKIVRGLLCGPCNTV